MVRRLLLMIVASGCALPSFEKVDAVGSAGGGGSGGGESCPEMGTPAADESCARARPFTPRRMCGPDLEQDCCETLPVSCGTFNRSFDGADFPDDQNPATVSAFFLDRFEVNVARFREWIDAGAPLPEPGDGAHPTRPETGWVSDWNNEFPASASDLSAEIENCNGATAHVTWQLAPGSDQEEARPMNCVDWYTAFAFCVWDRGRLPTEAEWNFAAAGGAEQRVYPWSDPPNNSAIDATFAAYNCPISTCVMDSVLSIPGSFEKDTGRFGQMDLGGNLAEWMRDSKDWHLDNGVPNPDAEYLNPCIDCVDREVELLEGEPPGMRVIRGGVFFAEDPTDLKSSSHGSQNARNTLIGAGFRCARDPIQ